MQGVSLGEGLVISCAGQADYVYLLSNDLHSLNNLLQLTLSYCKQYHIQLCTDKTKLLKIDRKNSDSFTFFNPVTIFDQEVNFTPQPMNMLVFYAPLVAIFPTYLVCPQEIQSYPSVIRSCSQASWQYCSCTQTSLHVLLACITLWHPQPPTQLL